MRLQHLGLYKRFRWSGGRWHWTWPNLEPGAPFSFAVTISFTDPESDPHPEPCRSGFFICKFICELIIHYSLLYFSTSQFILNDFIQTQEEGR
jgi:hypothetical protein